MVGLVLGRGESSPSSSPRQVEPEALRGPEVSEEAHASSVLKAASPVADDASPVEVDALPVAHDASSVEVDALPVEVDASSVEVDA
jgi:hypothetical protein